MGKVILVAESSDVGKPVLATLARVGKELVSNLVENIAGQTANHAEQGKLLQVKQSFSRKATSKEKYNWFGCLWVKAENLLCSFLHMLSKNRTFGFATRPQEYCGGGGISPYLGS